MNKMINRTDPRLSLEDSQDMELIGQEQDAQSLDTALDTPWDRPAAFPIVVGIGQLYQVPPGSVIHVQSIVVEAGGVLEVKNGGNRFTCIKVAGDCRINGVFRSNEHRGGASFTNTAPDGSILDASLYEDKRGGNGGNGSSVHPFPSSPTTPGGNGALGTKDYGGGGGGASGTVSSNAHDQVRGQDAQGPDGGAGAGVVSYGGRGGRGGRRRPNGNGGYVYIRVEGTLNVTNGLFDFRGGKGENGEDGQPGINGIRRGGGGGGGPGCQGGTLYLRAASTIGILNYNCDGGDGGSGGLSHGNAQPNNDAKNGTSGEKGYSGSVQYL